MAGDNGEPSEDLKGLCALYALLCYAARELESLGVTCADAEEAIAAAQAAILAKMSVLDADAEQLLPKRDQRAPLH